MNKVVVKKNDRICDDPQAWNSTGHNAAGRGPDLFVSDNVRCFCTFTVYCISVLLHSPSVTSLVF